MWKNSIFPSDQPINTISTHSVDEWRFQICDLFTELSLDDSGQGNFYGAAASKDISELKFTYISAGGQIVRRGKSEIKRQKTDQFFLILQQRGICGVFSQNGDAVHMLPGDAVLVDPQTPYILNFQKPSDQVCIQIPSVDLCERISRRNNLLVGQKIDRTESVSKILAASISDLAENVERSAGEMENSIDLFYDIVASCLKRMHYRYPSNQSAPRLTAFNALIGFVVNNHNKEGLSPSDAASELGISARTLNRLCFENSTTFGRLVLNARLTASAHALREIKDDGWGLISHIAFEHGFADLSHFSKSFKAKYGVPPRKFMKNQP